MVEISKKIVAYSEYMIFNIKIYCHSTVHCMQRSNIAPKVILAIQGPEIDTVNSRSNAREMILAIQGLIQW